jgi:hypothetical protein
VTLAEVDQGGFALFLAGIYAESKKEIEAKIEELVTKGLTPYVGPFIAGIAGKVAAYAVTELMAWLQKVFEDDYFGPQIVTLDNRRGFALYAVPSPTPYCFSDVGGYRCGYNELHFFGHGGHYDVYYHWRFSDWVVGSGSNYP